MYVGIGVGVSVGVGVAVGSGVAVSVGRAVFVGVTGEEVALGIRISPCGDDSVSGSVRGVPPDKSRQDVIVNVKATAAISKVFEFISLL
jgi:hypothetical protein